MGRARDQAVRLIRGRDADLHQGSRILGRIHLPGQHRSDSLVRILSIGRQFLALPAGQRRLLIVALILVAQVRAVLCMLPSRLSVRLVRRLTQFGSAAPRGGRPSTERVAWAVIAASRLVPRATCLTQAISGQLLLRYYGYAAKLCLGVSRAEPGRFLAHAWIEHDGRVVLGGAESAAFTRFSPWSATLRENPTAEAR